MICDWRKNPYRWQEGGTAYISIAFTFDLPAVRQDILDGHLYCDHVVVGGPAVKLMPDYLADIAETAEDIPGILQRINPQATRTTIGCPNRCGFCAVPRIEGDFRELDEWPNLPIVCDNNLLASSRPHFDRVIDGLKLHKGIDFNQGLDARLLTGYHAGRLAELDCTVRLAWDNTGNERHLLTAVSRLRRAGIPRSRMGVYIMIGYRDTPEDALYRLETCYHALGILPNPMRYVPLDSLTRHYVGDGWTHEELVRMQRYWSNIRYLGAVPYAEWLQRASALSRSERRGLCRQPWA